jgi:hypothetical protein
MSSLAAPSIVAPVVRFFSGRSEMFVGTGADWRRLTPEDEARLFTGFDKETKEPAVGVYVVPRSGHRRMGFDLWRIGANLKPDVIARLRERWRAESANVFSKTALRAAARRVHFSKSFIVLETTPERVDAWKAELESILLNPNTYESI